MSSNGDWGHLVVENDEAAAVWDGCLPVPEPGENLILDGFVERKNLTHSALVRIGTRMLNETTLAFIFPGGIKFRSFDGRRWNSLGADFLNTDLKIVQKHRDTASIIMVAEGETDAAWLSEHYDADVAILPAGARTFSDRWVPQLMVYDRVIGCYDRDEAGDEGWRKLVTAVPYAERLLPPEGSNDFCEGNTVVELPEPESLPVRAGSIWFVDIMPAVRGELPAPEVLVDDLIYDVGVHTISGHPDSGKSLLAMMLAHNTMDTGRHVVWLDYEQGVRMTGQRLGEMGIPHELLAERFHYAWYAPNAVDELAAVADAWPGALVVIDSMSKALAQANISENENSEVLAWTVRLIQGSKALNLPVVVIDHVRKDDRDGPYARGAGTKQADTDVHWKVEKLQDFNREQQGLVRLSRKKDREGWLRNELFFAVGDGSGGLPITRREEVPGLDHDQPEI